MHPSKQSVTESKESPNTAGHLVQLQTPANMRSSSIRVLQQSIGNQALQRMVAQSNSKQAIPRDMKEENGVIQGVFLDKHKNELPDHLWYKIFVNSGKSIRVDYLTRNGHIGIRHIQNAMYGHLPRASEAKVKKMSRTDLNEKHIKELDQALSAYRGSFLV
ncbi:MULTISPECIES: hypothetical protein [Brevibacillus]|uniref:Uncharacterized protein n=1 Tax=Brevibacillus invocatus TaxID=173959 RepID=A0A3M8C949_9BACL|nr:MULTISPECIES: hypothetical protein [Brevibacillus]MDH4616631.1 hypothetical protein [Brevibacillus sp. AY1]RNB72226.1 hypothetical protein EDM52_13795 [Brevibacillus invocatus]